MELILGSTSPRRLQIMRYFNYPFRQEAPLFDESTVHYLGDPQAYVTTLALEKANSLQTRFPKAVVLTADTTVFIDNKVLGKPVDRSHAIEMLSTLSGKWHSVFTAIAVLTPHVTLSATEETKVLVNPLSQYEIERYVDVVSVHDKAGAYAIQEAGGLTVKEIRGCYFNILGLPINSVKRLLQEAGINLWDFIK